MNLKKDEVIDMDTGEIVKKPEVRDIVADALAKMEAHFAVTPALIPGPTLVEQYLVDEPEGVQQVLDVAVIETPTEWFPGTVTPAHDGEYEVINPVNGEVGRATYDTLFEQWSCMPQYPTWRGLKVAS